MEESIDMSVFDKITHDFCDEKQDISSYSSLALAYIGDSVYENIVRSLIISLGNKKVEKLHDSVTYFSRASMQAYLIEDMLKDLTQEEITIFKRARNASKHSQAKHQTIADYKRSTGFEALIGWLYLKGEDKRIIDLLVPRIKELI